MVYFKFLLLHFSKLFNFYIVRVIMNNSNDKLILNFCYFMDTKKTCSSIELHCKYYVYHKI